MHQIKTYVEQWCPEKVNVLSLSLDTNEDMSQDTFQSKDTVKINIPSSSRRLCFVPSQWFSKLVTPVTGTVHERHIVEFESSEQGLIPFATLHTQKISI